MLVGRRLPFIAQTCNHQILYVIIVEQSAVKELGRASGLDAGAEDRRSWRHSSRETAEWRPPTRLQSGWR